jgi:hypothetical protein
VQEAFKAAVTAKSVDEGKACRLGGANMAKASWVLRAVYLRLLKAVAPKTVTAMICTATPPPMPTASATPSAQAAATAIAATMMALLLAQLDTLATALHKIATSVNPLVLQLLHAHLWGGQ